MWKTPFGMLTDDRKLSVTVSKQKKGVGTKIKNTFLFNEEEKRFHQNIHKIENICLYLEGVRALYNHYDKHITFYYISLLYIRSIELSNQTSTRVCLHQIRSLDEASTGRLYPNLNWKSFSLSLSLCYIH